VSSRRPGREEIRAGAMRRRESERKFNRLTPNGVLRGDGRG
jgi:hypothetical protein